VTSNSIADSLTIVLADSIADVPRCDFGQIVISGSHGGISAAVFSLRLPVKGVLFNDAGVGKEKAGIAGIYSLEKYGVYAAAVDAFSAEIGRAEETLNGRITYVNQLALEIGVLPDMEAIAAAQLMSCARQVSTNHARNIEEVKPVKSVIYTSPSGHRVTVADSNSMIGPENLRDLVFTGSHGGLVGDKPAVPASVVAVFYNDAGFGKNGAGVSRLPWLERNGIAAATVSTASARIGVGMDTYSCGMISHANAQAAGFGIKSGMRAMEAASLILQQVSMP
jgi:hypothetical protein